MTGQPLSPGAKAPALPLATVTSPIAPVTAAVPPVLASTAAIAGVQAAAEGPAEIDTDDQALAFDPEPLIETPTPTQAENDDAKVGVRQPDPPIVPTKTGRTMKPARGGGYATRDLTGGN